MLLQDWATNLSGVAVITDPYCPPVGATSPDDTPLIVECGEELPPTVGEIKSSESK